MRLFFPRKPLQPTHVAGTIRGEEMVLKNGQEAGRGCGKQYRSARDSTSIAPDQEEPILPEMPSIPPA